MVKVAGKAAMKEHAHDDTYGGHPGGSLGKIYAVVARPLLKTKARSLTFLLVTAALSFGSLSLLYTKDVTVKLLPFDNKSELSVVIDLPAGASVEATDAVAQQVADRVMRLPEVISAQTHAGTATPFNFNGLVRHYYLRGDPNQGDVQVNLTPKGERDRTSHQIALEIRKLIATVDTARGHDPEDGRAAARTAGHLDPAGRGLRADARDAARRGAQDRTGLQVGALHRRCRQQLRQPAAAPARDDLDRQPRILRGPGAGRLRHDGDPQRHHHGGLFAPRRGAHPDPDHDRARQGRPRWSIRRFLSTPIPANVLPGARGVVELGDVVTVTEEKASYPIFRHNGRFAEMVTGELAGAFEAPLYGMIAVDDALNRMDWAPGEKPVVSLHGQPDDESHVTLLWDGEWEVTWVTFRDMGAAFAVALLGIYILVVAQFGSFRLPLVILTPIPLTFLGIMAGHWLFHAPFSATSMIGFIALAGIIVRNSILLVDFIRHADDTGKSGIDILIEAGAIRFKPILLTAIAAMIGAVVILSDPIFQGLAISLLFGLLSSTLLTVLVIPAIYRVFKT